MNDNKLDLWAIVELFGHQKIAGKVMEHTVGSSTFIRVDVPEIESCPAFTRIFNPSAIYAINPVTEEVALYKVKDFQQRPIESWDIQRMHEKLLLLNSNKNEKEEEHPLDLPL